MNPFSSSPYLTLLVLFSFLFLSPSFGRDTESDVNIFSSNGKFGIKDDEGNVVVNAIYDKIGWSDGFQLPVDNVIGYKTSQGWGLMNTKGKIVSEPRYYTLHGIHRGLVLASVKGKFSNELLYGALNSKGNVQIDFKYRSLEKTDRLLIVSKRTELGSQYGLIDEIGTEILPIRYAAIESYHKELYQIITSNQKIGLVNTSGQVVLEPVYHRIDPIQDDKAIIQKGGAFGEINAHGKIITKPIYKTLSSSHPEEFTSLALHHSAKDPIHISADSIRPWHQQIAVFRNGVLQLIRQDTTISEYEKITAFAPYNRIAKIQTKQSTIIINENGQTILSGQFDDCQLNEKYIFTKSKGSWHIYNLSGEIINSSPLQDLKITNADLVPVKKGNYWGYINSSGEYIVKPKFDDAQPFEDELAIVDYLGFDMAISKKGKIIINDNAEKISFEHRGYVLVKSQYRTDLYNPHGFSTYQTYNELSAIRIGYLEKTESGKVGFVTMEGINTLQPVYDEITPMGSQYLKLVQEDKVGLANFAGKIIMQPSTRYQEIGQITDSKIAVQINGSWGFVNFREQLVIANRYDDVKSITEELTMVKMNQKWGIINPLEKILVQPNIDEILPCQEGVMIIQKGTKQGVIAMDGKQELEPKYDRIAQCLNGMFIVEEDGKFGIFSSKGKPIVSISFEKIIPTQGDLFIVSRRGKFGLIDKTGHYELPLKYAQITEHTDGQFVYESF